MRPIETVLYAEDPASTAIGFMWDKRSGLMPVVGRDEVFIGLLSGDRLIHFMLPRQVSMMRDRKYAGYLLESRE